MKKHELHTATIKRIKTKVDDDASFSTWSKEVIIERQKQIEEAHDCLDKLYMKIVCDYDDQQLQ